MPESTWDKMFEPKGYGSLHVESFDEWNQRVGHQLNNICPEIREQWIYRHWTHSPTSFVPLETLSWREEKWPPHLFLSDVKPWRGDEALDPEFDYKVFANPTGKKLPTAEALDRGEWDFAPPVLSTPFGFIDTLGNHIDARYLLLEGHQRRRYLNALVSRGVVLTEQRVFVLESPIVFQK